MVQEVWSICCPLSHSWRDPVYRGCDVSLVLAFYLCLKLSDLLLFISAYHDNLYSVPWLVYRTSKWVRKSYIWTNSVHIINHHHHHHQFDWKRTLDRILQTFGLQWFQRVTHSREDILFFFLLKKEALLAGRLKTNLKIWEAEGVARASTNNPLICLRGFPDRKYMSNLSPIVTSKTCCIKNCIFLLY